MKCVIIDLSNKEVLGFMDKEFLTNVCVRMILILCAAGITTLFYNNTLAWNFNLPNIGFLEFVLGFWAMRFCKVAIFNVISKDP